MFSDSSPEGDLGSAAQPTQTRAHISMPRRAFVRSLISAVGVAIAAGVVLLILTNPNLSFESDALAILAVAILLTASLTLAILGLGDAVSWRRTGGRGWQSVLSIVLAAFAILGVTLAALLLVLAVVAFIVALSEI